MRIDRGGRSGETTPLKIGEDVKGSLDVLMTRARVEESYV